MPKSNNILPSSLCNPPLSSSRIRFITTATTADTTRLNSSVRLGMPTLRQRHCDAL